MTRVLLMQQRLLAKRTPALRGALLALHARILKPFESKDKAFQRELGHTLYAQVRMLFFCGIMDGPLS